nr:immunoglobulin light chain junction region [Macaca mulatta]MOX36265.1 immunoglobulin light chain junction region [Macaca mulatta]MOX36818.1 immunoglobulin light chain junction region [Macaca mulatta]
DYYCYSTDSNDNHGLF